MFLNIIMLLTLTNAVKSYLIKDIERNEVNIIDDEKLVESSPVPDWVDWRDRKMVTPVKNQMHCGACWAFTIVAAVESHRLIHLNVSETLSEQFLVDCIQCYGCNNAPILSTMGYIISSYGGILRDKDYKPYQDRATTCTWDKTLGPNGGPMPAPVIGFKRVYDEESMVQALYENGPLIVAINSASMAKYTGGIDEPTYESCDPKGLDHTVLVVGYNIYADSSRMVPYWIIKNSWGTEWGDKGYYYLVRGKNACGIGTDISFPYVG